METSPYFFHHEGRSSVVAVPREASSDDWWDFQRKFVEACTGKDADKIWNNPRIGWVLCFRLWPDQQYEGVVFWDEELAGPDGISVALLPMKDADASHIRECRRKLKRERDVVRMSTINTRTWLEFKVT